MQRLARTYLSVCPSGVNVFVCTSIIHARLHMQLTACVCLLDIGFAFVLISASHASRHRLRIILTSAAHILDIGFALTPTIVGTQPTLTLENSQIRVDIGFALTWHMLRIRLDFGFALSWTDCTNLRLEILPSASHSSWHRLRIIWTYLDIGCAYSWHRLRITSNNPWNPTYLNSAELPNSCWHWLRIILTYASHSAWLRLRIVLDWLYKIKLGDHGIGFAFVLTSASHYLEPVPIWYSR